MKNWFIAVIITVLFGGCSTLEVQVDYNPKYDFSSLSTFAVVYTNKNDQRDFSRARISQLIEAFMQDKGYKSVDKSKADFYITMHLDVQQKSQVETNYETMGIRPMPYMYTGIHRPLGAYPGTYPSGAIIALEPDVRVTTSTHEYEEGRLVLEVFDVKQNEVVWQGIAKDELSAEYSQKQKSDYINNVIAKLFKDFPLKK
ncbi:MAG: DUF4136 domain-containing protein [Sulfurimonas sp.]|uniref:DUF4136 domain-containing protein n=1 Tax=Sulfurimonas sp. TaxID=2022749 RepID=UPI0026038E22|nr:DUF4136 domain-containing protein [Sulfurimonas sp.]MCW8895590.1 DUF4136 domain-containing protein [Sulfurimonas sp.]MCW8954761.1 DUF4136 domain-containing protein [Sulfurimonas sp.]MCW9067603.1 DUF4136 domain-containing protein [Sulfurimonas sp.]